MHRTTNKNQAFTLIELLVVIAIIALLASIVLVALGGARSKSRDADRRATVNEIGTALELFYSDNNAYPSTGNAWSGNLTGCPWGSPYSGLTGSTGYVPGLAPTYVGMLPVDPLGDTSCSHQYLYISNGTGYLFMAYGTVENCANISSDPMRRPAFPTECDYAIYSPNYANY